MYRTLHKGSQQKKRPGDGTASSSRDDVIIQKLDILEKKLNEMACSNDELSKEVERLSQLQSVKPPDRQGSFSVLCGITNNADFC